MNTVARAQPLGAVSCEAERAPKLAVVSLASAAALVAAAAYVICLAISLVAPDLLMGILQSWAHSISLAPLRAESTAFQPGSALVGLLTFSGFVWLTTAATAWLYNSCHLR
jgi:2TM family of unknown function (DUF5676)